MLGLSHSFDFLMISGLPFQRFWSAIGHRLGFIDVLAMGSSLMITVLELDMFFIIDHSSTNMVIFYDLGN